jgi:hypothetical protein
MDIIINIDSSSDIKKLTKKIALYKFLYKKRNLKLKYSKTLDRKTKYELETFEKAFNLKRKKERLAYIYDRTYDFIANNYVETNFCEFENDQCISQRIKNCKNKNGCCGECKYLKNKRCSINALSCKLYFCSYINKKKKAIKIKDISFANCFFTIKQKIIVSLSVFQSREKMLEILHSNSLILWYIKTSINNNK